MFGVGAEIIGVDEYIVEVNDYAHIKHISEDFVHEVLKGRRGVGKSERNYQPFVGTISRPEHGFPFVALADSEEVVGVFEVDFRIYPGFAQSVEQVHGERNRVSENAASDWSRNTPAL